MILVPFLDSARRDLSLGENSASSVAERYHLIPCHRYPVGRKIAPRPANPFKMKGKKHGPTEIRIMLQGFVGWWFSLVFPMFFEGASGAGGLVIVSHPSSKFPENVTFGAGNVYIAVWADLSVSRIEMGPF